MLRDPDSESATVYSETVYLILLIKRKSFLGLFIYVYYLGETDGLIRSLNFKSSNNSVHMEIITFFIIFCTTKRIEI